MTCLCVSTQLSTAFWQFSLIRLFWTSFTTGDWNVDLVYFRHIRWHCYRPVHHCSTATPVAIVYKTEADCDEQVTVIGLLLTTLDQVTCLLHLVTWICCGTIFLNTASMLPFDAGQYCRPYTGSWLNMFAEKIQDHHMKAYILKIPEPIFIISGTFQCRFILNLYVDSIYIKFVL